MSSIVRPGLLSLSARSALSFGSAASPTATPASPARPTTSSRQPPPSSHRTLTTSPPTLISPSSASASASASSSSSPPSPLPSHPASLQSLAHHLLTSPTHGYPITPHIQHVAWGDQDSFQHLNNVLYARYFESARLTWVLSLCHHSSLSPTLTNGLTRAQGLGMILARLNITFRRPVVWPDTLLIAGEAVELEKDRFTIRAGMWSLRSWEEYLARKGGEGEGEGVREPGPVATADQVCVTYDYERLRRADMPEELRGALREFGMRKA